MIDPQDLINLPGYGNAQKELRKAGLWRDDAEEHVSKARHLLRQARDHIEAAQEATE
jgi:hypothetical protein